MTATTYALISDRLVLGAMVAFALAMVSHATAAAVLRRQGVRVRRAPRPAMATATTHTQSDGHHADIVSPDEASPQEPTRDPAAGATPAALPSAIGTALLSAGLGLTLVAVVARGAAAGRTPWSNMYEFTVVGVAAVVTAYLVLASRPRTRVVRRGAVWVAAAAALFLGLASTVLYTPAAGLIPVLDSAWLVIHVAAAIVAGGLFTVGAVMTVLHLLEARRLRRRGGATTSLADSLEQAAQTAYTVAFPIWTFAVIAGAIWAENSWGRYWGWDPKETWAFITWVLYAAYLHAQATGGWRGTRASWLALAGYAAFLFNFVGVNIWVGGLHSYAGV